MSELLPAGPHCSRWVSAGRLLMFCYHGWVSEENDNKDCHYRSSKGGEWNEETQRLTGKIDLEALLLGKMSWVHTFHLLLFMTCQFWQQKMLLKLLLLFPLHFLFLMCKNK